MPGISIGLGLSGRRGGGAAAFDETSLFDVDGAFFDADDPATLYQESTGSTLVSATGQQVGFQGDKSQGFALWSELVTNGGFDDATGWTLNGPTTISGGVLNLTAATGNTGSYTLPTPIAAGAFVRVTYTILNRTAGGARISLNGSNGTTYSENGTYTQIIFVTSGASTFVFQASSGTTLQIDNVSVRPLPDFHATQSGSSFRPFFRETSSVGYLDYDALDDRLVGTAVCGSSGNSIAVKTTIPASVASTQVIMGLSGASTDRFFVGVNTSGFLCAGVGTDSVGTIVGDTDIRGETGVAFLVEDGDDVFLYWNDTLVYTAARNGAPSTTQPFSYGCLNANGTASSFYGGGIWKSINLQRPLTATERANILTKWS